MYFRLVQDHEGLPAGATITEDKFKGIGYISKVFFEPIDEIQLIDFIEYKNDSFCIENGIDKMLFYNGQELDRFLIKKMNFNISDIVLYLIGFSVFVTLQALAINGVKESLTGNILKDDINKKINYQGNILYMLAPRFFEKYKYRYWSRPLFSCVRCMSSVWGGLTYWPIVLIVFGFNWSEVLIFVWDVFILVYLNYYFYKKI